MNINRININQIISVVVLVIAGLIAINIYKSQSRKIAELHQIHRNEEQKRQTLIHIRDLKRKIEAYKQLFQLRDRREIINMITDLAAATGVKIISLKPIGLMSWAKKIENKIYDKVFFKLTIQIDDYHQLGKFVSRLENEPTMFFVDSLNLMPFSTRSTGLTTKPDKLQVELTISKVFF